MALKKTKAAVREAQDSATTKDMVSFDQLMLEEVDEDDFVLGAPEESDAEGVDKDLAKAMGIKGKGGNNEGNKKGDKWAELSQVGSGDKAGNVEGKFMKFKTEISKDLACLEGGPLSLNKSNGDKEVLKSVKAARNKAKGVLVDLQKLLDKKGAKKEVVAILTKALETLKECKAVKVRLSKALKA